MSDEQVRIISDGTKGGTQVYVGDIRVKGVQSITWRIDAALDAGRRAEAVIVVRPGRVDLDGEPQFIDVEGP